MSTAYTLIAKAKTTLTMTLLSVSVSACGVDADVNGESASDALAVSRDDVSTAATLVCSPSQFSVCSYDLPNRRGGATAWAAGGGLSKPDAGTAVGVRISQRQQRWGQ
jgi:hypothetical protein